MNTDNCQVWCTDCGYRVPDNCESLSRCPKCGSTGVPCHPAHDVKIEINWHELRILGIWARNWAEQCEKNDPSIKSTITIDSILGRLERQFPDKAPLSLAGELRFLRQEFGEVQTSREIKTPMVLVYGPGAVGFSEGPGLMSPLELSDPIELPPPPKDQRIVYGMNCLWWDSIDKCGSIKLAGGRSLPCCPNCKGPLFELPDEESWWKSVKEYAEKTNNPEYVQFIEWQRGKCFRTLDEAEAAHRTVKGSTQ